MNRTPLHVLGALRQPLRLDCCAHTPGRILGVTPMKLVFTNGQVCWWRLISGQSEEIVRHLVSSSPGIKSCHQWASSHANEGDLRPEKHLLAHPS